jgi:hypothetical protein
MRINIAEANRHVKPIMVSGSGHKIELSMLEPVTPMLDPWWRVRHHSTEKWMIGKLIAPTKP